MECDVPVQFAVGDGKKVFWPLFSRVFLEHQEKNMKKKKHIFSDGNILKNLKHSCCCFLLFLHSDPANITLKSWPCLTNRIVREKFEWILQTTPPKTKMEPENGPLEKEIPFGKLVFGGGERP